MRERQRGHQPRYRNRSNERRQGRSRQNKYDNYDSRKEWKKQDTKPYTNPHYNNKPHQAQKKHQEIFPKINRKQTSPFLIRVFYAINNNNDFQNPQKLPTNEIQLHQWMDSTLLEIGENLRAYLPSIRTKQRFQFWRVYLDEQKKQLVKQQLGTVLMHRRYERSEQKALQHFKFNVGEYLDVSINYK